MFGGFSILVDHPPDMPRHALLQWPSVDIVYKSREISHLLSVTETSRQIYAETRLLFFSLNDFYGYVSSLYRNLFLRLTESQLHAIRTIHISKGSDDIRLKWRRLPQEKTYRYTVDEVNRNFKACLQQLPLLRGLKHVTVYLKYTSPNSSQKWRLYEETWKKLFEEEFEKAHRVDVELRFIQERLKEISCARLHTQLKQV